MRAPLVAAALLLATVAPPAGADVLSPLLPLVDAAAQRLQTADPVAAAKYLTGGAISDPPRERCSFCCFSCAFRSSRPWRSCARRVQCPYACAPT